MTSTRRKRLYWWVEKYWIKKTKSQKRKSGRKCTISEGIKIIAFVHQTFEEVEKENRHREMKRNSD